MSDMVMCMVHCMRMQLREQGYFMNSPSFFSRQRMGLGEGGRLTTARLNQLTEAVIEKGNTFKKKRDVSARGSYLLQCTSAYDMNVLVVRWRWISVTRSVKCADWGADEDGEGRLERLLIT